MCPISLNSGWSHISWDHPMLSPQVSCRKSIFMILLESTPSYILRATSLYFFSLIVSMYNSIIHGVIHCHTCLA
uniref:Uncharacterized protein n=1 Tax=Cyclopterus lumpus TaxID=8103 RepID=A0A8C2X2T3_CYCLU